MRLLSSNRLVTLTGPGGGGKTRLALAAAAELVEVFDDGPWVVELGSLSHPSLVPQALASTLGVRERPGRSPSATLCEILQNKSVLLVLDNCEHLIDACTSLTETLLHACTGLRIMAATTVAVTFWYAWLFNRTGGSVLLVLMAHSVEGSLQAQGWIYMGVWCTVALVLLIADREAWRRPPPVTQDALILEGSR